VAGQHYELYHVFCLFSIAVQPVRALLDLGTTKGSVWSTRQAAGFVVGSLR